MAQCGNLLRCERRYMSFCLKRLTKISIWFLTGLFLTFAPALALAQKDSRAAKLTQGLIDLHEQQLARMAGETAAPLRAPNALAKVVEERVTVDAVAADDAETLKAELEAVGMQNAAVFGRIVSGGLPVSAIADAAN